MSKQMFRIMLVDSICSEGENQRKKIFIKYNERLLTTLARLVDNGVDVLQKKRTVLHYLNFHSNEINLFRFCLFDTGAGKRIANPLVASSKSVTNFCFLVLVLFNDDDDFVTEFRL